MSSATSAHVLETGRPDVASVPRAAVRTPRPPSSRFHLALRDRRLQVLFEVAAAEHRIDLVPSAHAADWIVTDAVPVDPSPAPVILALPDVTPLACRTAVELVEQGTVAAVLTPDRVSLLGDVARLAQVGQASLPRDVVAAAAAAPAITSRQREVLRLVARGCSNHQAASRLHVSATTVKRDVSELLRALGCRSRIQLRAAARDLGLLV